MTSSGGTPYASAAVYYPNCALSGYTYGNGIIHTMEQNDRQLPKRSWMRKDGIDYIDDVYAYDGNGNVASIQDMRSGPSAGTRDRTMSYDGLDRLEAVASPMYGTAGTTYTYNVLDDLTRVRTGGAASRDHYYCYDASRRLTNIKTAGCGGSTVHGLGYDAQGNLQNKDGQQYRFDFGNRLREVDGVERYRYDAHGRRALAMQFGTETILSMYGQDGRLMYQKDFRTGKQNDSLYLGGSLIAIRDEPIGEGAGTLRYQHTDALGSPVAVTDQERNVLETTDYEPFGKVLNRPVHDGPGYTGHVEDAATGLTYMQQRYYDPGIGRFLSVDPVAARPSGNNFNRYSYAANNPYRFIDPDGREVWGAYSNDSGSLFMVDLETKSATFVRAESGGKPFGDPVPTGDYSILSRAGREGFCRLERRDSNFGDDRTPEGRSNLRLHGPGRTTGCISVCEPDPFRGVDGMLKRTSTGATPVDDKSLRGRVTGAKETLANFGTMRVLPAGVPLNVSKSGEVSVRWSETGSRIKRSETLCTIKDGKCQ